MNNNRIIKFRVWSKKHNKWINNSVVIDCNGNIDSHYLEIRDNGEKIEHIVGLSKEENIIQQFTSLKDKNSKEIYEGDLVKDKQDCLYEVYWLDTNAMFDLAIRNENKISHRSYNTQLSVQDILIAKIEIVGNIFENSEYII